MRYDVLIITNLPSFYKINLYNKLSQKCQLLVIFLAGQVTERNKDFLSREDANFDYHILSDDFNHRNVIKNCLEIAKIARAHTFSKLILGEWSSPEYWFASVFFRKKQSALTLESNVHSSRVDGWRKLIKRFFLSRVRTVLASGPTHVELLDKLNYSGNVLVTNGVGIINYGHPKKAEMPTGYLYIGRLSEEKNLALLIEVFNALCYPLTIAGEGPEESYLKSISNPRIKFIGYVGNRILPELFAQHRALILPSSREPYGLVAEEAIYYGCPVILSNVCGILNAVIRDGFNGLVFQSGDAKALKTAIQKMNDDSLLHYLQSNCTSQSIRDKDQRQIETYHNWIKVGKYES